MDYKVKVSDIVIHCESMEEATALMSFMVGHAREEHWGESEYYETPISKIRLTATREDPTA